MLHHASIDEEEREQLERALYHRAQEKRPARKLDGVGEAHRVDWRFTTGDARIELKRLYPSLQA